MSDTTPSSPAQEHKEVSPKDSTLLGFEFAWELGYTIAIPAVLLGLAGRYVDTHLGTGPWCFLGGLTIAFVSSFISIYHKVKVILARMPKDLPKKEKENVHPDIAREQEQLHDLFRPPKT